jgi:hypothetical protein
MTCETGRVALQEHCVGADTLFQACADRFPSDSGGNYFSNLYARPLPSGVTALWDCGLGPDDLLGGQHFCQHSAIARIGLSVTSVTHLCDLGSR